MSKIAVKILGTGAYLPSRIVTNEELEKELGYPPETFIKASGVTQRRYVTEETSSEMGMIAAKEALKAANLTISDIDAIVSVSGVPQQAIPSNAALIHQKLGLKGTLAFDINSSCISFLTGLFCMGNLVAQKVYNRVLLVSADIPSSALNPKDPKIASLFGDGAAACIIGPSHSEGIITSHFETRSEYIDYCQCEGGGTLLALKDNIPKERHYFRMDGLKLYKAAMPPVIKMVKQMMSECEIDLFIPHQASPLALDLLQRKLGIKDEQFIHIVRDYGNMIATSLPFALHLAIASGKLKRGDKALLFGTAAGLTIGGVLIEY